MKKVILITGGSRGIGAATAISAAAQDYLVCLNYRSNEEAARKVAAQIEEQGAEVHLFQADIASEKEVEDMFESIDRQAGRITHLVNNAGTLEKKMLLKDMSVDRWNKVFATNVTGTFLCSRAAVRRMSTSTGGQGGVIVNVSSAAARLGSPFEFIDYASTKGAMDTMTIGLAQEVAEEGIRVNGVRPGLIYTDIHALSGQPDRITRLAGNVPLRRGGSAQEVANLILWLLSDEASYVTGTNIDVTGGR